MSTRINKKIFKAYDIRGLYPEDVNEESIRYTAKGLVKIWSSGKIVVARDGRHGGEILTKVMIDSIIQFGEEIGKKFEVIPVGLSTTPMFYFLVNDLNAEGGAMITASHNPKEYNGVKAVKSKAIMIPGSEILNLIIHTS